MKRVLVGTDGSDPATAAVAWAVGFTLALGGELVVATVLEPGLAGADVEDPAEQRTRVTQLLQEQWCAPVRAALPGTRTLVLDGDPRTVLPRAVLDEGAEMLVLGSGTTGWFPALHLDHVAHALAQHTDVPLVIVPRD